MKPNTIEETPEGGLQSATCSALIEADFYVSACGRFHGCSGDYTEEEWDEIVAGDNVMVYCGTTLESARAQLMDAGLSGHEVDELIPLPNAKTEGPAA